MIVIIIYILDHHASTVKLDCTLLVLAQIGVFVYAMFSIMGSYFTMQDDGQYGFGRDGLIAEILSLIQCSTQTLFVNITDDLKK
jgi:hypothetical protein